MANHEIQSPNSLIRKRKKYVNDKSMNTKVNAQNRKANDHKEEREKNSASDRTWNQISRTSSQHEDQ